MPSERTLSTAGLDYLQRADAPLADAPAGVARTEAAPAGRTLLRVRGIGRYEKLPTELIAQLRTVDQKTFRLSSQDALTGLYGHRVPVAWALASDGNEVAVHIGAWSPSQRERGSAAKLAQRGTIVQSVVRGLHPTVELEATDLALTHLDVGGLVTGVPTAVAPDIGDVALPIDRLIRAMTGEPWAALVLAEPVGETSLAGHRHVVLNELRAVQAQVQADQARSPLAEHYEQLLTRVLADLTRAQGSGGWRTGVYLLGTASSYPRLAGAWRSTFAGDESLPEPVRVWHIGASAVDLAGAWAMPDVAGSPGPGFYRRLFEHQTLLTSAQLAAYVHLPHLEVPGYAVETVPQFDAVVTRSEPGGITLGDVVQAGRVTSTQYRAPVRSLSKHVFVSGVTGSGKTNTISGLLLDLWREGVPFLVLEPAKTEYRAMAHEPELANVLQVFTLGDELTAPFRLNPFEVPEGSSLAVHLDLLRSLFTASFGMWNPLPQILEACLHEIYADRGWDVTTGSNHRTGGRWTADAFPTLSDLADKAHDVIGRLAYAGEVSGNMRAALETRINGLRVGGKGRMLDVQRSFPFDPLLQRPTVLELEAMGDDDDRAFVMGLLLIRLAEARRAQDETHDLRHLLVIEEAHRLLTNVGERSQEEGNSRGKAVEAFVNLLAEVRAYGEGVLVADQVPTKLAPDVIKNTNLKVAHRIVAEDDRKALGGSMAMTPKQIEHLATLTVGRAALYSEGDDAPVLVQIRPSRSRAELNPPTNAGVAKKMAAWRKAQRLDGALAPTPVCEGTCVGDRSGCEVARQAVEGSTFMRAFGAFVLAVLHDPEALARRWPEISALATGAARPGAAHVERCAAVRATERWAARRGAQAGWSYEQTATVSAALRDLLLAHLAGKPTTRAAAVFRKLAEATFVRAHDPFPACSSICGTGRRCTFRHAAADVIADLDLAGDWDDADRRDRGSEDQRRIDSWYVAKQGGYELLDPADIDDQDAVLRASLCVAQQLTVRRHPSAHAVRRVVDDVRSEALGHATAGDVL